MKKTRIGTATQTWIALSIVIILFNVILGGILVGQSKKAIKTLIDNRMLDIAETASNMLNGNELLKLKKEDVGTQPYYDVDRILTMFMDNIDLRYIYTVRKEDDGSFTFMVDPDLENPAEFGSPVVVTEALIEASKGTPAVDKEPYEDEWGRFYSAYSPVFASSTGSVAAIVVVDFDASWYDAQMKQFGRTIVLNSIISLLIGGCIIFIAASRVRKHIEEIREKQSDRMITALASDYWSVYYVDLDNDDGICFRVHKKLEDGLKEGEEFIFSDTFSNYAKKYVTDTYRDGFLKFIQPSAIRAGLEKNVIISYRYLVRRGGKERYEMLRMAGVRRAEDREDGIVHVVGVGFSDVDREMKKSMMQADALKTALFSAQEANRSKTAFLANISHEMRTPMNAIIGCDKFALEEEGLPENVREDLEQIGSSATQLLGLINNILDMSRIEKGNMILNAESFSLGEILNMLEITFSERCKEKGITWKSSFQTEAAACYIGDGERLEQAIVNLLDNAVKFTPKDGSVNFLVEKTTHFDDKSVLSFTVSDTGIGMDEEYSAKVFEIFSQKDPSMANQSGSTGLGLAITKNIVEMMNGTISVESQKGKGSTFVMTVTLTDTVDAGASKDLSIANAASEAQVSLSGRRILVAEDVPINAKIVEKILKKQEMEVEIAHNGKEAVDFFSGHEAGYYDAILMDLRMPVMDGFEATRMIRGMDREDAARIPIIALSANAFDEDVQNSLQAGMDAHLSKPADPDEITGTIRKMISK